MPLPPSASASKRPETGLKWRPYQHHGVKALYQRFVLHGELYQYVVYLFVLCRDCRNLHALPHMSLSVCADLCFVCSFLMAFVCVSVWVCVRACVQAMAQKCSLFSFFCSFAVWCPGAAAETGPPGCLSCSLTYCHDWADRDGRPPPVPGLHILTVANLPRPTQLSSTCNNSNDPSFTHLLTHSIGNGMMVLGK